MLVMSMMLMMTVVVAVVTMVAMVVTPSGLMAKILESLRLHARLHSFLERSAERLASLAQAFELVRSLRGTRPHHKIVAFSLLRNHKIHHFHETGVIAQRLQFVGDATFLRLGLATLVLRGVFFFL